MKLIKVTTQIIGEDQVNAVNARELYRELEVKKDFSDWMKHQIKSLSLDKDSDYILLPQKVEQVSGAKHLKEYIITLDTAKHIAMASRTPKGKEVRKYFIEIEKSYNRAVGIGSETIHKEADAIKKELGTARQDIANTRGCIEDVHDYIIQHLKPKDCSKAKASFKGQITRANNKLAKMGDEIATLKEEIKELHKDIRYERRERDRLQAKYMQLLEKKTKKR